MPVRATKRGAARTRLNSDADVVVCGASFAGLAACRELAGSGARVLLVDRYEIGERQTSACAAPTEWIENLGLEASILQSFDEVVCHTPRGSWRWPIPWSFSTFDYAHLCDLLAAQGDFTFDTAKVEGVTRGEVHRVATDRGELRAPLVLDALGWRRLLADPSRASVHPPTARMSRGLEVHPAGNDRDLELFLDPKYVRAGYGWSFPAGDEVRVGVGSFDPRDHVKDPTLRLVADVEREPDGWQGNWIPHRRREPVEDGIAFAGDSAGHCIAATAEGIRPALFFGLAAGRAFRAVVEGHATREVALRRYATFVRRRHWKLEAMWHAQTAISGMVPRPRALTPMAAGLSHERVARWCFGHYLRIAPPSYALQGPHAGRTAHGHASAPAGEHAAA